MTPNNVELEYDIVASMSHLTLVKEHLENAEKNSTNDVFVQECMSNALTYLALIDFKLKVAHDIVKNK